MRKYNYVTKKVLGKTRFIAKNGKRRFAYKKVDYIIHYYEILKPKVDISPTLLNWSCSYTPIQSMLKEGLLTINQ